MTPAMTGAFEVDSLVLPLASGGGGITSSTDFSVYVNRFLCCIIRIKSLRFSEESALSGRGDVEIASRTKISTSVPTLFEVSTTFSTITCTARNL